MIPDRGRRRFVGAGAAAGLLALDTLALPRILARAAKVVPDALVAVAGAAAAASTTDPDEPLYAAPTTLDRVGRVLAPVLVDGQGPFRFIVDTGATRSALSPQLVARLGLPTDRSPPVRMQGVTGEAVVPTVRISRLQAGSLLLLDRELPVLEPHVFAQADGILGVEGMAGNRLDIDFVADRVTISRSRAQRAGPGFLVVPVHRRSGSLLIVDARIGRVRGRDTPCQLPSPVARDFCRLVVRT